MKPTVYTVHAYRWGDRECHSYSVGVYSKKHAALKAADERATGVDKSFISRLMNGHKVAPSAETLEAMGLRAVPLYEVLKRPNAKLTGQGGA